MPDNVSKTTFGVEEYYASGFVISRAKQLLALRKVISAMNALAEDCENDLRFEIEERGRKSCDFPMLSVLLKPRKMTRCACCAVAPWDCPNAREGQLVRLEEYEVPRYVEIVDKTQLPKGVLRAVKLGESA